ncbi:MAG: efflux RND transporter permease subunit [bacterium]
MRATFASVGQGLGLGGGPAGSAASSGTHVVEMAMHLVSSEKREVGATEVAKRWRELNRDLAGLDRIIFSSALQAGGGDPIDVVLSHRDVGVLEQAAARLAQTLTDYQGVTDVDDGFAAGKRQLSVTLKPEARALGLTEADLAAQIRAAFFGAEALRQQRDRDEVKVLVRLPRADREELATFETLMLRTPAGGEIPLLDAAFVREGRAETAILREDGRRVIHVTGDVDSQVTSPDKVLGVLTGGVLDELKAEFPGLSYGFGGQQQNWGETMASLKVGFPMAMFVVFALLAVPFRSYVQPLIIMTAIPFGFIGAVVGHLVLGYDLSIISMMGVVALAGIVVNDSLILVMAINERRAEGMPLGEAVVQGALRRFRPILLTSLTTFFGLMPMIFEPSVQARFLIPMAISLGFGVLFSTLLILLMIPAIYLIVEDIRAFYGIGALARQADADEAPAS